VKVCSKVRSVEMGGTNRFLVTEKTLVNRCRFPADRKLCIIRSRFRGGTCEFSALLFRPLCARCTTLGMTCLLTAAYEGSLSVRIRLGAMPCCFINRVSRRLAALVSRRLWTISSST